MRPNDRKIISNSEQNVCESRGIVDEGTGIAQNLPISTKGDLRLGFCRFKSESSRAKICYGN